MAKAPVLIYRLGSLGDTVVALPCFHRIAASFPDQRRMVLTNVPISSKAAALDLILRNSGLIDGIVDYNIGMRSFRQLNDLARRIRAVGAETMIYLSAPRGTKAILRDLIFFRMCGLKRIIGAPLRADFQNRIDPITGEVEPEAERLARTMAQLGSIDLTDRANWDLHLTAEEISAGQAAVASAAGRPMMAVNIGGKAIRNHWGSEHWQSLLGIIGKDVADYCLTIVGSQEDRALSDLIAGFWQGPSINLCGALAPRVSAAALRQARFFIGHDSGPMHLAACVGTPAVGLFGDNNRPRMWHPYGSGNIAIHDMRGVRAIEPERVRAAVRQILGLAL